MPIDIVLQYHFVKYLCLAVNHNKARHEGEDVVKLKQYLLQ